MRAFCFKHNKLFLGFVGKNFIELKCGCKIKRKDVEKHKVIQKTKYFLSDGREIKKVPEKPAEYVLGEKNE